ncbi:MAG: substrate-binding domain-containing protein [Chloroflexi bacterium]|nr:substrate-binding domain-containing protein [Chloroflexota bacterium]
MDSLLFPRPATTYERRQVIVQLVRERAGIKVTELAKLLDVSEGTIRNDLSVLDEGQQVMRVRGGAVTLETPYNHPRSVTPRPQSASLDAEQRIARWAAGLVENGDVILMDGSAIMHAMASFLNDRQNLTVVTNSIEVGQLLATNPTNTVILIGGILRPDGTAVTGSLGERILKDLRIQTAFVSCYGFSVEAGFLERDIHEAELKRHMLSASQHTILLLGSAQLEKPGLVSFASAAEVNHVITDSDMPDTIIDLLRGANLQVTVCGEKTVSSGVTPNGETRVFRIGFANLSEALPFARDVRRGLERAVKQSHHLELIVADNQLDPDIALNIAEDLIAQHVDLAIEYQIDENMGSLIAHKFNQAHIPVIAVDIPMVGATFFGVDNYKAGYMAGRALGHAVQERWYGNYDRLIVLEHPRTGQLPAARIRGQIEGFTQVIGHLPGEALIYLDSGNTTEISQVKMRGVLDEFPEFHSLAVVCFNDEAAVGALEAARELNRENDVLIVGQGADRRLRDELRRASSPIIGSTAYWPEHYGSRLIDIAVQILNDKPVPPAVYTEHVFITAQNVEQY